MGEPFILNNLETYTRYAEAKGVLVYLNTNASLMTPDKIDRLIASGFSGAFNISFHAA
jgi:MoaA/NifB/PqqE/SkfB family radical SAM enzyme